MFILLLAMKFNIDFNDEQCSTLLDMQGYVVEEVMLYYNPDTDPYENDEEIDTSLLRGVKYKVVYKQGYKPEELEKEYPLIGECRPYIYANALSNIINNWLYHMMLKNEPYTW